MKIPILLIKFMLIWHQILPKNIFLQLRMSLVMTHLDLQPISENEFRKLVSDRNAAFIKYKYHHDRRLANYFKIKDFMDTAQRRHGSGGVIYLSKEGSKLLLRKKNTKSLGGVKRHLRG